jgi:hypothetical protein
MIDGIVKSQQQQPIFFFVKSTMCICIKQQNIIYSENSAIKLLIFFLSHFYVQIPSSAVPADDIWLLNRYIDLGLINQRNRSSFVFENLGYYD